MGTCLAVSATITTVVLPIMPYSSISMESVTRTAVLLTSKPCSYVADQAVMMVKEANNMYDPNATAVQTLNGQVLGYVPKENTARFLYDITFGHVYSFGPNALGLWGVTVSYPIANSNFL